MLVSYLLLILSAIALSAMAILRKEYQKRVGAALTETLWFSFVSSTVAALIGFCISGGFPIEKVSLALSAAYAFLCTTTAILCIVGAKYGSVSGMILYGTMGTLVIPTCFGLLFDPTDTITAQKAIGLVFAALTLLLGFADRKKSDTKVSAKTQRLSLAVFFTNGSALVVFKLLAILRPEYSQSAFVSEYMLLSAIASLLLLLTRMARNRRTGNVLPERIRSKNAIFIPCLYAVTFFTADYFAIRCAFRIPLTIQAPLSFCLPVLFTAALEFSVYRQRFSRYDWLQMGSALLCSICFVL